MDCVVPKKVADGPISQDEGARLFGALDAFPVLVLAVSGGPDSTALMWLAARWRDRLKQPPRLVAVTVDHALRKESAREARDVAKLARKLGIEHRTLFWKGRKPRTGIQEAARNARYRLLAEAARDAGAQHLLTAHTLDDQAETLLFRMARGSGVTGLAAMSHIDVVPVPEGRSIHLIRPLLGVPKARLIATLRAAHVPYVIDPSNSDPRFTRPRLRKLMPVLATEGLTAERLAKLAQRVERVEDALFKIVNHVQAELCPGPWAEAGRLSVDAEAFLDLPAEIGLRLLQRMIDWSGNEGPVELSQLETLHAELRATGECIWLEVPFDPLRRTLAGGLITLTASKLTVERAPPRRTGAKFSGKANTPARKAIFTKRR